jgi:hypothetical protein
MRGCTRSLRFPIKKTVLAFRSKPCLVHLCRKQLAEGRDVCDPVAMLAGLQNQIRDDQRGIVVGDVQALVISKPRSNLAPPVERRTATTWVDRGREPTAASLAGRLGLRDTRSCADASSLVRLGVSRVGVPPTRPSRS